MGVVHMACNRMTRSVSVLFAIFLWAAVVWGQATTSLRGTVTDPSGAAVPNATVRLTNADTNVARTTTTTTRGEYVFPEVLPGNYALDVEASGFSKYHQAGVTLLVNLPATADVRMKVGTAQETITVTEKAPIINRTDATVGQTMGTTPIENLPLQAENTVLLLSLQPGVVYNGEKLLQGVYDTRAGSVNGERSDQNNITLDGVSNNDEFSNYAFNGILPTTPFSVQEFRVTTSNYGATEGHTAGAQIAMVTKSGTNTFHGNLYEFNRNTLGEANDWFLKQAQSESGQPNTPEHLVRNVFGGDLGGPILKNRLFFFFNYEGNRQSLSGSATRTIPSATLRDGIIEYACETPSDCPASNVTGASGASYPVQAGYYALSPAGLASLDPLGIGPSQVALKYFNEYPMPNNLGAGYAPNYALYTFAAPTQNKYNWYIARLDYNVTQNGNHTVFFRGTGVDDRSSGASFLPGNNCPLNPGKPCAPETTGVDLSKGFVAGYTAVLTPHWVNSVRWGLTRASYGTNGDSSQDWIGMRGLDQGYTRTSSWVSPVNNVIDTVSWQKGAHNFQFGGNLLLVRALSQGFGTSYSDALTNSDWVDTSGFANQSGSPLNPPSGGFPQVASDFNLAYDFPLAAMMGMATEVDARYNYHVDSLTQASTIQEGSPITRHWATDTYNLFFQDTWQLLHNFSVSYGLNYQLMTPVTETAGQQVEPNVSMGLWFDQRVADMQKGIPSNQDAVISFAPSGSHWGKTGLYSPQTKNFAPRIGLAWTPQPGGGWRERLFGNNQTSIRAGFGMYYDNFGPELAMTYNASGEFGLSTLLENPAGTLTVAQAPRITSMNTIPTTDNSGNTIMPPAPPAAFPVTYTGVEAIARGIDPSLKTPYSYAVDFSIQRQLPGQMTLDVAYVGHFAHRLLSLDDIAVPLDLVDPASKIDYFAAATRLSQLARAGTPDSAITASLIGPTAQYWQDMIKPQSSYTLKSTGGTTTDPLVATYDMFKSKLHNETSALYDMDRAVYASHGWPTFVTGYQSFYNPQYSSLWDWRSMSWSNYNALEVGLHKQMSNGVLFGFDYTYSHGLDVESMSERGAHYLTDSIINPFSPQQMYSSADTDLRHQINAYWVAQLPFGHGRRFGGNDSNLVDALIGGWQLSGTTRWTSGFPTSVFQGYVWPTNWDEMGWSNLTGQPVTTGTTMINETGIGVEPNVFKDPTAAKAGFDYAFPGQSGARNAIRGDGFFGWDMNLQKQWRIVENQSLEARWSVFNVSNSVRFDAYGGMNYEWDTATFGNYSGATLTSPRVMELALIYSF